MSYLSRLLPFLFLIALPIGLAAQQPEPEKETISIDHADVLQLVDKGKSQRLIGGVELSQDSIFMYCDSAELVEEVQVYAYDNVVLQQGDSLAAFSRFLDYNAETRLAKLRYDVVLKRGETELYTERLDYDLATRQATYHTGGRITRNGTELRSIHGYYYADTRNVYFRDSVVAVDDRFEMRADTLRYDLAAERVYFLGPTVIRSDTHQIYCEAGYYDVALDQAVFEQNAQYKSGERLAAADVIQYYGDRQVYVLEGDAYVAEGEFQRATADRIDFFRAEDRYQLRGNSRVVDSVQTVTGENIDYDARSGSYAVSGGRSTVSNPPMLLTADEMVSSDATGIGTATGDVIYRDTSAQLTVTSDRADYNQRTGYLKASGGTRGRPLMSVVLDADTMYMAADTLISLRSDSVDASGDTVRYLAAYKDVRILKSDIQAVADSLGFNTVDSILTLYQNPVLWQDTSQLTADTIDLYLKNEAPDKVVLRRNAMVITSPDLIFFNQVRGKEIQAYFNDSSSLERTEVNGNAEAIYYAQDDSGAYIGVDKTACSRMVLFFEGGGVYQIKFLAQPSGRLDPMGDINHETFRLEGFRWLRDFRPVELGDLFGPKLAIPVADPARPPRGRPDPAPARPAAGEGGDPPTKRARATPRESN